MNALLVLSGMRVKLNFHEANESDEPALVDLLANCVLGANREDTSIPLNPDYLDAFHGIDADSNNELTIIESGGELVGMLQLIFIPYLTHIGSWRCLIEGVRIANTYRGKGLGTEFINWAIKKAKERRCSIVQLTSDKQRPDAIRFYESLGFKATHEGFKLKL